VDRGCIRNSDDHVALRTAEPKLRHGTCPVGEQPLHVPAIGPGAGDYFGAVEWPHVVLVVVDHLVDDAGIDDPLFHQEGLQRLDSGSRCVAHAASR
jgi:hypothetical protein